MENTQCKISWLAGSRCASSGTLAPCSGPLQSRRDLPSARPQTAGESSSKTAGSGDCWTLPVRLLERLCYFFGGCWSELGKPVVMRCVRTMACLVWLVLLDMASSARLLRRSLSGDPEARCRPGQGRSFTALYCRCNDGSAGAYYHDQVSWRFLAKQKYPHLKTKTKNTHFYQVVQHNLCASGTNI